VPTLFTRIIDGDLPANFVWKDDVCVAFLSIAPLGPGHTLVVPRAEVDHWLDLEPEVVRHLAGVTQSVGKAIQKAYDPVKVGSVILGLEVPHVHIHVAPIWSPTDLDFHNADPSAKPEDLAREAEKMRGALRALGYAEVADS
jgi:diadenosine tetraphosphate (Ap4A) HIT family hydrolase